MHKCPLCAYFSLDRWSERLSRRLVDNLKALILKRMKVSGGLNVQELIDLERILNVSAQHELQQQPNFQQLVKSLGLMSADRIWHCQGR